MKITKEGHAIVERDSHLGKWVEEHGRLDFDQNAIPQYLKYFPGGGTLINIGANIGCYAYAFVGVAKEIHCFEPNKEAFECLKHNMRYFPKVYTIPYAVSNNNNTYSVDSSCENVGMAFTIEDKKAKDKYLTIDGYFKNSLVECSFILMDCEGHELKALQGAEDTINKFRPIMVIEINDHTLKREGISRNDVLQWLHDHNYSYRNIYEEQDLSGDQLDIICFPK